MTRTFRQLRQLKLLARASSPVMVGVRRQPAMASVVLAAPTAEWIMYIMAVKHSCSGCPAVNRLDENGANFNAHYFMFNVASFTPVKSRQRSRQTTLIGVAKLLRKQLNKVNKNLSNKFVGGKKAVWAVSPCPSYTCWVRSFADTLCM